MNRIYSGFENRICLYKTKKHKMMLGFQMGSLRWTMVNVEITSQNRPCELLILNLEVIAEMFMPAKQFLKIISESGVCRCSRCVILDMCGWKI